MILRYSRVINIKSVSVVKYLLTTVFGSKEVVAPRLSRTDLNGASNR